MLWKLIKKLRRWDEIFGFFLVYFRTSNMEICEFPPHTTDDTIFASHQISDGSWEFQFNETYPGYLFHVSCHVSFVICVCSPRIHFNLNLIFPTFLIPFGMDFISHFHHFTTSRRFLLQKTVKVFQFCFRFRHSNRLSCFTSLVLIFGLKLD